MTGANSKEAPIIYYPKESIPDIVAAHLRADRNLTPERARALEDLFRPFTISSAQENRESECRMWGSNYCRLPRLVDGGSMSAWRYKSVALLALI